MFHISVGLFFTLIGAAFGVGLYSADSLTRLFGRMLARRHARAHVR